MRIRLDEMERPPSFRELAAELEIDQPRPIPAATEEERRRFYAIPLGRRVSFDTDEAYTQGTEEFSRALVRFACPSCFVRRAPLLSPRTRWIWSGWQWRGISHQEPVTDYLCRCPTCQRDFALHLYTPQ